jgi:heptosyltransferase-1
MKVLIVKLSSLGDVVHSMPAVQDILKAYPKAQIDWVVERSFAPVVARCVGVRRLIVCDLRRWVRSPLSATTRREWRAFKAELQSQNYDAVIDLQGLSKSALVSRLARTSSTGKRYSLANQTEGSSFEAPARWVADVAFTLEPHVHAVDRSRLLCALALGYEVAGPVRFGLIPKLGMGIRSPAPNEFAPRKPIVTLVHGTSRADKQWPVDSWIEVGLRLNHQGFKVALVHGSDQEKKTSQAIAKALEDAVVWPTMDLDILVDTLAQSAGVIGVDSGISHIAVALGLAHVQIYNFDTAWRTGPHASPLHASVFAMPTPEVDAVWQAWEKLATPALCR